MNVQPFGPSQGTTQAIVPAATAANVTWTGNAANYNVVRVVNKSSVDIAINFGGTAVLPVPGTPGDAIVATGATEVFTKPPGVATISVIGTGAGTGNVYFTAGEGQ